MSNRYHLALARGAKFYEAAVQEDKELLHFCGLQLLSVEGCVRAAVENEIEGKTQIHPWNVVEISMKTWELLRPFLIEARANRTHVPLSEARMAFARPLAAK